MSQRGMVLELAAVVLAIALAPITNVATNRGASPWWWVAFGVLALASVAVVAAKLWLSSRGQERPPSGPAQGPPRARAARPGTVLLTTVSVVLVIALLTGGLYLVGGFVSGFFRYFPPLSHVGESAPTERLAKPRTVRKDGLELTMTSVAVTNRFTKVQLKATNKARNSTIRLDKTRCQLSTADGWTTTGRPFGGDWPEEVPPDQVRAGTIEFERPLPAGPTKVSLTFTVVFGWSGDAISLRNVPLKPTGGS